MSAKPTEGVSSGSDGAQFFLFALLRTASPFVIPDGALAPSRDRRAEGV